MKKFIIHTHTNLLIVLSVIFITFYQTVSPIITTAISTKQYSIIGLGIMVWVFQLAIALAAFYVGYKVITKLGNKKKAEESKNDNK